MTFPTNIFLFSDSVRFLITSDRDKLSQQHSPPFLHDKANAKSGIVPNVIKFNVPETEEESESVPSITQSGAARSASSAANMHYCNLMQRSQQAEREWVLWQLHLGYCASQSELKSVALK